MTNPGAQALATVATNGGPSKPPSKALVVREQVKAAHTDLAQALPAGFPGGVDRFERIVLTAVSKDPNLLDCSARSIIGAALQAAQLGLTPNVLGEAWIIPYGKEASFQVGWKGLVVLASRAGVNVEANTVHLNDQFAYELGLNPQLRHVPASGDRGPAIAWYAVADHADWRRPKFAVLDRAAVEKRRKASKSGNSPAWRDWYSEMALGKAVREVLRTVPLSVDMSTALASDGIVRTDLAGHAEDHAALNPADIDGPSETLQEDEPVDAELVDPDDDGRPFTDD